MNSPGILAALLGLCSAAAWGAGDFCGGLASKRTRVYSVVAVSQFIGLLLLILFALLFPEGGLALRDMIFGALGGIFGALGLLALYSGLASGVMGLVAPISAVVAAIVPLLFSLLTEGVPGLDQLLGFGFALIAIWLITRGEQVSSLNIRDLRLPMLAGAGFGIFFIFIDQVSESAIFWPLVSARSASILMVVVLAAFKGNLERPSTNHLPLMALVGVLDTGGNVFFALATRLGRLDISAMLASLYPAVTVLLAWILLEERLSSRQWIGIGVVLVAIALIV